eukprot:6200652-Pleurochrysis_carterae.AAC.1
MSGEVLRTGVGTVARRMCARTDEQLRCMAATLTLSASRNCRHTPDGYSRCVEHIDAQTGQHRACLVSAEQHARLDDGSDLRSRLTVRAFRPVFLLHAYLASPLGSKAPALAGFCVSIRPLFT